MICVRRFALLVLLGCLAAGCVYEAPDQAAKRPGDGTTALAGASPASAATLPGPGSETGVSSRVGTWRGTLAAETGEELPFVLKVAPSGYIVYPYQTNRGPREAELTEVGQTVRFVPPGGGVVTFVIESLDVGPEHVRFAFARSFERTRNGILDQERGALSYNIVRSDTDMDAEIIVRMQNIASQPGFMVPGDEQTVVYRGKLNREKNP